MFFLAAILTPCMAYYKRLVSSIFTPANLRHITHPRPCLWPGLVYRWMDRARLVRWMGGQVGGAAAGAMPPQSLFPLCLLPHPHTLQKIRL